MSVLDEVISCSSKMVQDEIERLRKALDRQCDNMAFILNHAETYHWFNKFDRELQEDRKVLAGKTVERLILNELISDYLPLSKRAHNCLYYQDILTVGDLVRLPRSKLLAIPKMGVKTVAEIISVLDSNGLKLNQRVP